MDEEDMAMQDGPSGLTCGCWIPMGACKAQPEKYHPTPEELSKARSKMAMLAAEAEDGGDAEDAEECEEFEENEVDGEEAPGGAGGDNGDDDDDDADDGEYDGPTLNVPVQGAEGVHDIESDDESDIADMEIKADDCVFLCTHQRKTGLSSLEVYVYDDDKENIYLHHDIMLPAIPLSVAWSKVGRKENAPCNEGSFAAVTTFLPFIEVWDLDITDSPDPCVTLGGCKRESDNYRAKTLSQSLLKKTSHTDAVLCAKWNSNVGKVLASGSADCTLKLWDLGTGDCLQTAKHHHAPVQCIEWFKQNPHSILTGSFDQTVQAVDCRTSKVQGTFNLGKTPETLQISPFDEMVVYVTTDDGELRKYDLRQPDKHVWKVQAHSGEAGGLCLNPSVDGLLATAGSDKQIKLWDVRGEPVMLSQRDLGQGRVFSLQFSPDKPTYMLASGDEGKPLVYCVTDDVASAFGA